MISAFKADGGIVTTENSSGINYGVSAVVLISEAKIIELGLNPEEEWMGGALGGVDPVIIGIGPVENTRKLLNRPNMTMADIDIEGNEAFAAQSIVVKHELRIPYEKLSVNGGRVGFNG